MTFQSLKILNKIVNNAEHICLFGIGALLHDCFNQIVLSLGREPDFLCDNAPEKWGREYFGKKCISPQELSRLGEGTVVIITVKKYEEIIMQINKMGIKDVFVTCYERTYNAVNAIKRLEDYKMSEGINDNIDSSVIGKWTLITGASRGIGRQIAIEMARMGSNIIAHSRSISNVRKLVDECSVYGVSVVPIAAELSNLTEVEAMLLQLGHLVPQIDIVFNNAGISLPCTSDIWTVSSQDYIDSFTVNTIAPVRICQRLIPPMIKRGYGRVINISSSIQNRPGEMAYACSKAALDKFVHDLAPSLNETGVAITLSDPGWLSTDMGGVNAPLAVESVIPGVLLGAVLDCDFNGRWLSAQDYTGMSIGAAVKKAKAWLGM